MNTHNDKTPVVAVSLEELAQLGTGALSYIRAVEGHEVNRMVGGKQVPPDAKLFCLFNANGAPISISGTREAAAVSAEEHELIAISVH
jgi:hypothetical protein